jgi:hypothetical protein
MTFVIEPAEVLSPELKEEKNVLGTVANVKYYHQAAAWDSPLSFGVQAFIEYNGLVLNDRHQADLIRVNHVGGLDDAEVRDSREPRPGESGEYAYDAFYGGRNLVLSGFVEAGSLAALGTLSRNLKAAFASLNESYLKFRWFDVYDPFDDPNTILEYNPNASLVGAPSGNYSPIIGSLNNLKIENGLLLWSKAGKVAFVRSSDKRTFCDTQMTIKCIVGEKDSSYIGFILCAKNSENYLAAVYEENSGSPTLKIVSVINNEEHKLVSKEITSSLRPVVGQPIWIRGRKEGNNIYCEFYNAIPTDNSLPNFSVNTNLFGEDEEIYGDGILSEVGIIGNQVNTNWAFDEYRIESIYPGDIQFKARKINFSMADEQTSLTKFKRPFQITMKTSDFRAFSSVKLSKSIYPTNATSAPALGRSYPRKYPLSYRVFTSSTFPAQSNLLSINNRGSVYVEPILYLYGPGENILIENLANGQSLEWLGAISEGDYIEIDCREKTIVNSIKSNFLEPLVPTTEWIRIEPMWNDIYIQGSGFKEEVTKFIAKLRHGYM